jgi:nitrous oxidase accessory protein NosD
MITGADGTNIQRVTLEKNKIELFASGSTNTVVGGQNTIKSNEIGVSGGTTDLMDIHGNVITGNNDAGISFDNTDKSVVWANVISKSTNGIFLSSDSGTNVFKFNNLVDNSVGINNAEGQEPSLNGNNFTNNKCTNSKPS